MEYRELGRSGEKVSVIGMGTWRIGVFNSAEERQSQVDALRRGLDLGINLIDTAEMYATGRSEEVVADAIRERRDDAFVATKVSPENLRHDAVLAACESSLKRLGLSYIDLYQVHWPNPSVPIQETMSAMEELVNQGKVRYVGVSNFDVELTKRARESLSRVDVVSNQVQYSLKSRDVESSVLPYCQKEKLTLIAYSPLAKGSVRSMPIPEDLLSKHHMTPAQAALSWVLREEQVVAIPKAAGISHLEENAASASMKLTDSEYRTIEAS